MRLRTRYWALNYRQWENLLKRFPSLIDFPQLTFSQRGQLDANGALVKFLALIQLLYFILQLVMRKVKSLPSSQVEILTLAFAICSIFIHGLCWWRPQHVESVCIIRPNRRLSKREVGYFKSDEFTRSGPKYLFDHDKRVRNIYQNS